MLRAFGGMQVALGLFAFVRSARVEGLPGGEGAGRDTTPAGLLLLLVYTACDAFTWQWQARLYRVRAQSLPFVRPSCIHPHTHTNTPTYT